MRATRRIINNLFSTNENIDNKENDFKLKLINVIKENVLEDNVSFMFEISLYLFDLYRNYVNAEFTEIKNDELINQGDENTNNINSIVNVKTILKRKYYDMELFICYCWFLLSKRTNSNYNETVISFMKSICKEWGQTTLFNLITEDYNENVNICYLNLCRICLYVSCNSPYDEGFESLDKIIKNIKKNIKGKPDFKEFRKRLNNKYICSCYVIASDGSKYFALSGIWDNENYIGSVPKEQLNRAKEIIKESVKNIGNIKWCTVDKGMRSYNYRMAKGEFEVFENVYNKRKRCLKKHFSCCERKILINLIEQCESIKLWIRYSPCSDCVLALKEWSKEHHTFYSTNYLEEYKEQKCPDDCNLYL